MRELSVRDLLVIALAARNGGTITAGMIQEEIGASPGAAYNILNRLTAFGYMKIIDKSGVRTYQLTENAYRVLKDIYVELHAAIETPTPAA